MTSCVTQKTTTVLRGSDWELVRTVRLNRYGGTMDFVVVPPEKIRDLTNYQDAATTIAGSRNQCMIYFWTNRAQVPKAAAMPVTTLQLVTARYERYPTYKAPVIGLAAWLYPDRETAKLAGGFFMPGIKIRESATSTNMVTIPIPHFP